MTASSERIQCTARTKKGDRCKLYALSGEKVCHIHIKRRQTQERGQKQPTSTDKKFVKALHISLTSDKSTANVERSEQRVKASDHVKQTPGNIYVFTYAHMMHTEPTKMPYLHMAEPTPNNWINYNKISLFDPCDQILIKVGFTRKRPEVRIKEWREQCGHSEFILLYPGCLVPMYNANSEKKSIIKLEKLFRNLKIGKESGKRALTKKDDRTHKRYTNLNPEKTCFISTTPFQSEQKIHKILRERYGAGKLYCEGCAKHKMSSDKKLASVVGVHTEWFLVPRCEMKTVWDIIESQCRNSHEG